jgi:hypothetical protein
MWLPSDETGWTYLCMHYIVYGLLATTRQWEREQFYIIDQQVSQSPDISNVASIIFVIDGRTFMWCMPLLQIIFHSVFICSFISPELLVVES